MKNCYKFLLCAVSILYFSPFSVAIAGNVKAGQEKSATCQGCHGTNGNSYNPLWPHLASQNPRYLHKQVTNFQSGSRKDPTMSSMVAGLSKADIDDIVAFFSSQEIVPVATITDAVFLEFGRKIYKGGNAYSGVPGCAACHGPDGTGNGPAGFPHLTGQQKEYTIKTLTDFKKGDRANDPNGIMRNIANKMTEREIEAVASYLMALPHELHTHDYTVH